jgi:hypothetical protein
VFSKWRLAAYATGKPMQTIKIPIDSNAFLKSNGGALMLLNLITI